MFFSKERETGGGREGGRERQTDRDGQTDTDRHRQTDKDRVRQREGDRRRREGGRVGGIDR